MKKLLLISISTLILSIGNSFAQYQFTHYTTYNTGSNSLGSNTLSLIDENPATNEIFIKYYSGVMRYDNNDFSYLDLPAGYDWYYELEFAFDLNGNIWFGVNDSVYKYDFTNIYSYPIPTLTSNFNDILCDSQGNVWFARNNGVIKFDGTTMTVYSTSTGMLSDNIDCLYEDSNGNIWVGCGMGLHKWDGFVWKNYNTSNGFEWDNGLCPANAICEDLSGNIWIGGPEIGYFTGDVWTLLDPTTLLNSSQTIQNIRSISRDTAGVLWFGTTNCGVFYYDGVNWVSYTEAEGLPHNKVHDVFADSQNRIWITMESAGVSIYENNIWTNITTSDGLVENKISDIFEDTLGTMWFSTSHGLNKMQDNIWESWGTGHFEGVKGGFNYDYDKRMCLIGNNVTFLRLIDNVWDTLYPGGSFYPDFISFEEETYWMVGGSGVTYFHIPYAVPADWVIYNSADGLPADYANCIERDPTDKIWVGTGNGIARYMWPGFVELVPPSTDFGTRIHEIRYDWDNYIWFASNNGVAKFDGTASWEFFFESDGLADNFVWDIEIGSDSTIWFATYNGISVLTDTGMYSITKADGLLSNTIYTLEQDSAGNMWAGTMHGASKIHDVINIGSNSIANYYSHGDINVYPNPASNVLNVTLTKDFNGEIFGEIYNQLGALQMSFVNDKRKFELNIEDLKAGVYFINIKGRNAVFSNKFVKLK